MTTRVFCEECQGAGTVDVQIEYPHGRILDGKADCLFCAGIGYFLEEVA